MAHKKKIWILRFVLYVKKKNFFGEKSGKETGLMLSTARKVVRVNLLKFCIS